MLQQIIVDVCSKRLMYRDSNKCTTLYIIIHRQMSKMMLPIELTKILYATWQGEVSVSSQDSEIYGKCLNGIGKVTFKNGNQYCGNFHNGLLSGKGKFTWANGITYEGDFTDNRITGRGLYTWPDGSTYDGDTKDGLRHGTGKYVLEEATYDGGWREGKKHGQGKISFKSGSIFEGEFKNDCKDGFGKMYYYPSGNYFEGQWAKDVKHGKGTMNWTDIREKYVGEWRDNLQEGWGMHIWLESKGEGKFMRNRYQGNWKAGVREGYGVFYYANGSRYQGFWTENKKEGYAFYTNQNGSTSLILFSKDRMLRNNKPSPLQIQPNYYSQCLSIQHMYYPFLPNLERLYNYLLRNNTNLKTWYKSAAQFYDQQSEISFSLNLEGVWKMIRSLKVLGDFSLAIFDRGLLGSNPDIETLLKSIQLGGYQNITYEQLYYKSDMKGPIPFKSYNSHQRDKTILFREFIELLVWMSYCLQPLVDKPYLSIEKLIVKITPFLESLAKMTKPTASDNVSENRSSVSKIEKNISPFYRTTNSKAFAQWTGNATLKLKELLLIGKFNSFFAEQEYSLLEKVLEKYFDSEVLNRKHDCFSKLPPKLINILNYQLIEYEFVEILYILLVKKLPSTKENQENKNKYLEVFKQLNSNKKRIDAEKEKNIVFRKQDRVVVSKKEGLKKIMQERRALMEKEKAKRQKQQREKQIQLKERQFMSKEDIDIKDADFQEQESQFQI